MRGEAISQEGINPETFISHFLWPDFSGDKLGAPKHQKDGQ
jgi:hypothetical protein